MTDEYKVNRFHFSGNQKFIIDLYANSRYNGIEDFVVCEKMLNRN